MTGAAIPPDARPRLPRGVRLTHSEAQGGFVLLGAYLTYNFGQTWDLPFALAVACTATGDPNAFGETGGGFRKLIQIIFGLSIAFAASSFFLSFFSFGGGALIG